MVLTSALPEHLLNPGIGSAALIALLGYAVVFFGIILLLAVLVGMGKIFMSMDSKAKASASAAAAAAAPAVQPAPTAAAPGSAGHLKLHDVEPKTAAMLMAIVADKMGKPINELRFISIKEVK